jgi:hypothetical protein
MRYPAAPPANPNKPKLIMARGAAISDTGSSSWAKAKAGTAMLSPRITSTKINVLFMTISPLSVLEFDL